MRKNDLKKSSLTGRMVLFLVHHPTGSLERGKAVPKQKAKIDGKLIVTTGEKKESFPSRSSCAPPLHSKLLGNSAHPRKAAFTPEDPAEAGGLTHSVTRVVLESSRRSCYTQRKVCGRNGREKAVGRVHPKPQARPRLVSDSKAWAGWR